MAIDVKSIALHETGISVYTRNLVRLLAESTRAKHTYILVGPPQALDALPEAAHFEKFAVALDAWAGPLRFPIYDQLRLCRAVRRARADVMVAPNCDAPIYTRVPTLVVIHDTAYLRFPDWYRWSYRSYYGFLLRWHMKHADAIATDSAFARSEIELLGRRSAAVHIVPAPIEREFFHADVAHTDDPFGLPGRYVLYSGGADPRKDLANVWSAFASAVRTTGAGVSLVVTGSDGRLSALTGWARKDGLTDRLRLLGHVSREQMPKLYACAAAVVFGSRYEGFGLPVLEALAAGTPVVTTAVGFVQDLEPGLVDVVPCGDRDALASALIRILRDGRRSDSGSNAASRAREIVASVAGAFEAAVQAARSAAA